MRLQIQKDATAKRVKHLIEEKGVTQVALASFMGITKQAMSNKLNGQRAFSNRDYLALADFFEVSVDYLMGRSDTPWPDPWKDKEG